MTFKTAKRYKNWQLRGALVATVADVPGRFLVEVQLHASELKTWNDASPRSCAVYDRR